jgi:hypothetical protein
MIWNQIHQIKPSIQISWKQEVFSLILYFFFQSKVDLHIETKYVSVEVNEMKAPIAFILKINHLPQVAIPNEQEQICEASDDQV